MGVSSISVSRVSEGLRTFSVLETLRRNTLDLFDIQRKLATGERLNAPSDDPVLSTQALDLTTALEQQQQRVDNIRAADTFLSVTDTTMGEITELLNDAHEMVLASIGDLTLPAERDAAALLIDDIINRLVEIGNRGFNGVRLFGGRETGEPPLEGALGGVLYTGDTGNLEALVELNLAVPFNTTADSVFGTLSSEVKGYVDLNPAVTNDTRLTDLNGATGLGVRTGPIVINDVGAGVLFTVDLTGADRISDVVTRINSAATTAGSSVTASLTTTGLQITAAGTFSITDPTGGTAASDLGIVQNPPAAGPLIGQDVDPRLTVRTPVTALAGGAGVNLAGGLLLRSGVNTATVDLSTATTVGDILNRLNNVDAIPTRATINAAGTGLDVLNPLSGIELRIGENGGTTAGELGIRSLHGGTSLADLNQGVGVRTISGQADIRILAKDGASQIDVDLSSAMTLQDVVNLINAAAGGVVTADLVTSGNGLRITDNTGAGARDLEIQNINFSTAGTDLGIAKIVTSPATQLLGDDVNGIRPDGVFTTLIDLRDALLAGDRIGLQRGGARLEELITGVIRAHGEVGARSQAMRLRLQHAEETLITTETFLSEVKDLDFTEAITRFQQLQTTLQANLQSGARMFQLSLLNFLG